MPEYTEETVICDQVQRNNEEDYEEIPPRAEVGNDLYDSDSDSTDKLDFEDTVESIFNSDAELQFDDESFVGERENFEENEDQPLYPEASISLGTFMLLFTSFTMKHSLSSDGILQLLNIFSYVLPKGHTLCTSLYDYKKFFTNLRNPLVKHFYCPHCLGYLKSSAELKCPYNGCEKQLNENEVMYFLEMPVESQLRNFMKNCNIVFKDKAKMEYMKMCMMGVSTNHIVKMMDLYQNQRIFLSHSTLMELQSLRAVKCRYGHYSW